MFKIKLPLIVLSNLNFENRITFKFDYQFIIMILKIYFKIGYLLVII